MDELQLRILDAFHLVRRRRPIRQRRRPDPSVPESRGDASRRTCASTATRRRASAGRRWTGSATTWAVASPSSPSPPGCVGIDLSAAGTVIFAELRACAADCEQAEDRAAQKRRPEPRERVLGRASARARAAADERRWANIEAQLNKLRRAVDGEDPADETSASDRTREREGELRRRERKERRRACAREGETRNESEDRRRRVKTTTTLGGARRRMKGARRRMKGARRRMTRSFPSDLWFELSPHTSRAHLHAAADGSAAAAQSVAPGDARASPPNSPPRLRRRRVGRRRRRGAVRPPEGRPRRDTPPPRSSTSATPSPRS